MTRAHLHMREREITHTLTRSCTLAITHFNALSLTHVHSPRTHSRRARCVFDCCVFACAYAGPLQVHGGGARDRAGSLRVQPTAPWPLERRFATWPRVARHLSTPPVVCHLSCCVLHSSVCSFVQLAAAGACVPAAANASLAVEAQNATQCKAMYAPLTVALRDAVDRCEMPLTARCDRETWCTAFDFGVSTAAVCRLFWCDVTAGAVDKNLPRKCYKRSCKPYSCVPNSDAMCSAYAANAAACDQYGPPSGP
jgi:hypothetical protein